MSPDESRRVWVARMVEKAAHAVKFLPGFFRESRVRNQEHILPVELRLDHPLVNFGLKQDKKLRCEIIDAPFVIFQEPVKVREMPLPPAPGEDSGDCFPSAQDESYEEINKVAKSS